LEGQTTGTFVIYATSSFSEHSLLATVYVVSGIVNAVIKPPMAKIANVFGRLEAFSFSILLYTLGYIQQASSQNIQTFASAQIFYSAGFTGLQILQQIFIADTSDLLNRALFSSLPDVPFLFTVWAGGPLGQKILQSGGGWRWGYGIWAIVLPVAFLPLAFSLLFNYRKASKLGILPPAPWAKTSILRGLWKVWIELDATGLLLFSAAIALILLPLTLGASAGWQNPSIIAMLVCGCVFLVAFPFWESSKRVAPYPFLPLRLLKERNFVIGCITGFLYFAVFYTSIYPYFNSYLQVVQGDSIQTAQYITQTFSFTSTISSIAISLVIKYTKHYKYYITIGSAFYLLGVGLMIRYRVEGSTTGQIVGTQILIGLGGGMLNVPAQLAVQAGANHQDVAAATAIYLTMVEIGGAVGAAISGAVWTGNLLSKLTRYLPSDMTAQAPLIYGNISMAIGATTGSPERIAINRSYQETMNILLIIAACFAAPILPLSLLFKNYKLDQVSNTRLSSQHLELMFEIDGPKGTRKCDRAKRPGPQ
jgi:MFS family permease